jgi:hypothetical protein
MASEQHAPIIFQFVVHVEGVLELLFCFGELLPEGVNPAPTASVEWLRHHHFELDLFVDTL